MFLLFYFFFFSSRRRHTRLQGDWSSDVCSSDLKNMTRAAARTTPPRAAAAAKAARVAAAPAPARSARSATRSEERRVGKESGSGWWPYKSKSTSYSKYMKCVIVKEQQYMVVHNT